MTKCIAVAGANGYVGRAICDALYKQNDKKDFKHLNYIFEITRENYDFRLLENKKYFRYNILINSATPGKRTWANNNPKKDYLETVEKTKNFITDWRYDRIIHISSISARCETDTPYGKHKLEAETLVSNSNNLIVRLTAMFSDNLTRGALYDIIKGNKVYSSADSRFSFVSLEKVGEWIANNLDRQGLLEFGAKNTITLKEIADYLHKDIEFGDRLDIQEVMNPEESYPDAKEVLYFMERMNDKKV